MEHGAVAAGVTIQRRNVHFDGDVWLNHGVWFDDAADIHLGSGTMVGPGTRFITSTHDIGPAHMRAGRTINKDIRIGKGCFIGANVIVLPGITIADGCVIAAGAVVTQNTEPNGLYGGIPARLIRPLPNTNSHDR